MRLRAGESHEVPSSSGEVQARFPEPEVVPDSHGWRLDRGLTHDQRHRQINTRVKQAKINAAHRVETWARAVCVVAGLAIGVAMVLYELSRPPFSMSPLSDPPRPWFALLAENVAHVLLPASGIVTPLAALVVVVAWGRRRYLLRAASRDHLEVADPGKLDYR
jgi:hypothetical protein